MEVENIFWKKSLAIFFTCNKKWLKNGEKVKVFSANMFNIDKMLNVKPNIKFKMIIPEHYWDYLNLFDEITQINYYQIEGKK